LEAKLTDTKYISDIRASLKTRPISCFKYNHDLELKYKTVRYFQSELSLSQDGQELIIWNKRYNKPDNVENQAFVNAATTMYTEEKRKHAKLHESGIPHHHHHVCHDHSWKKKLHIIDEPHAFQWKKSNASCNVSQIKGIIFGGFSSRFWALRKQMNLIDSQNMPLEEK